MSEADQDPAEVLTRDEVVHILSRLDIRGNRVDEVLDGLKFPANKTAINRHLAPQGLDREALLDALGGSP
jgi:hypothetical protein